MTARNC